MNRIFMLNILFSIISFVIFSKCCSALTYTKCDERLLRGSINWINVSNCDPDLVERCSFKKGSNVTITTSFTSHENVNALKVKIYGTILGLSVPWRVNPDNACEHGITCPVRNNTINVFSLSMPISRAYPAIPVMVRLRLEDASKRPHYCIEFPAKIDD